MQVNLLELQGQVLRLVGDHNEGSSWLSLTDSVEPAPGEAREGSPHDNPTAQQIVQLLPLTQDSPGAPRLVQQSLHAILLTVPRSGDKHHHHLRAGQEI
ncbi:PREDICTED: putative golgin subfamily A member 6B [Cercocebus atys]|uniref:putative golgin subfamily A member 6B n=1 Tax=Cercocebus atys TaxID=9531 RepID=UPI0005F3DCC0|nr:PREDICTED: putative golgin subfamily A member 6B [Cercocebus atys]